MGQQGLGRGTLGQGLTRSSITTGRGAGTRRGGGSMGQRSIRVVVARLAVPGNFGTKAGDGVAGPDSVKRLNHYWLALKILHVCDFETIAISFCGYWANYTVLKSNISSNMTGANQGAQKGISMLANSNSEYRTGFCCS